MMCLNHHGCNYQRVFTSNDAFACHFPPLLIVPNSDQMQFVHINLESNVTRATNGLSGKMKIAS